MCEDVVGVEIGRKNDTILVETNSPDRFYSRLSSLALSADSPIEEVYSEDDNLEAVFRYLVNS